MADWVRFNCCAALETLRVPSGAECVMLPVMVTDTEGERVMEGQGEAEVLELPAPPATGTSVSIACAVVIAT